MPHQNFTFSKLLIKFLISLIIFPEKLQITKLIHHKGDGKGVTHQELGNGRG